MKPLVYFLFFLIGWVHAQEDSVTDSLATDSLDLEPNQKNKYKFYGVTQFTFNQAYFENWVSGGKFYDGTF